MITNRIRVSAEATDQMKQLKSKLKVGPLYSIARMGFTYSINDKRAPQEEFYKEDGMEFNRLTLLGDCDPIFISLLRERGLYTKPSKGEVSKKTDKLNPKDATSLMVAHINRGIMKLHAKIKNQDDLLELIEEQQL
jgi:DNA sulfur modification protein DndE